MSPARLAASGLDDLKHDSEHNDVNYYNLTHSDRCVEFSPISLTCLDKMTENIHSGFSSRQLGAMKLTVSAQTSQRLICDGMKMLPYDRNFSLNRNDGTYYTPITDDAGDDTSSSVCENLMKHQKGLENWKHCQLSDNLTLVNCLYIWECVQVSNGSSVVDFLTSIGLQENTFLFLAYRCKATHINISVSHNIRDQSSRAPKQVYILFHT